MVSSSAIVIGLAIACILAFCAPVEGKRKTKSDEQKYADATIEYLKSQQKKLGK